MKLDPVVDGKRCRILCQFFHRRHARISGNVPTNIAKRAVVPGISRRQPDGLFGGPSGFDQSPEFHQPDGTIVKCFGVIWLESDCLLVARQRLVEATELL